MVGIKTKSSLSDHFIIKEYKDMDRILGTVLVLLALGAGTSLLLSTFFRKKWVWFLPSITGVILIIGYALKIQLETLEGFEELGYIISIYMITSIILGNLMTNFLIIRWRKSQ